MTESVAAPLSNFQIYSLMKTVREMSQERCGAHSESRKGEIKILQSELEFQDEMLETVLTRGLKCVGIGFLESYM